MLGKLQVIDFNIKFLWIFSFLLSPRLCFFFLWSINTHFIFNIPEHYHHYTITSLAITLSHSLSIFLLYIYIYFFLCTRGPEMECGCHMAGTWSTHPISTHQITLVLHPHINEYIHIHTDICTYIYTYLHARDG